MLLPSWLKFTFDWSFKMRYSTNFYLNLYRNYEWSKLSIHFLSSKFQSFNFDLSQFLNQLRYKFVLYLILKLQSIVNLSQEGKSMEALLYCKTPGQKLVIYFINCVILILFLAPLYTIPICMKQGLEKLLEIIGILLEILKFL